MIGPKHPIITEKQIYATASIHTTSVYIPKLSEQQANIIIHENTYSSAAVYQSFIISFVGLNIFTKQGKQNIA